jgi:HK97 family phage major capsid protein
VSLTNILEEMRDKDPASIDGVPDEVRGKTPDELVQLVEILDAHLRSLHQEDSGELRDLTPSEDKAFRYGLEVRQAAMKRIEEHRAVSDVFSRRPEAVKRVYANISKGIDSHDGVVRMSRHEARDMALRVLDERGSTAHLRSDEKDQVEKHIRNNTDLARRTIVTENDAYRNAWTKLMTRPHGHMYLEDEERDAMRAYDEYRAASSSDASGGFAVPVLIDPSVIMTAQGSDNPFLRIARQREVNTDEWKGVSSAGVSWSFDAEAAEVSDDAPTIAQPTVAVHMARGFIPFSIQIGEDWPGFAAEMSSLLAEGYDELLVDKFTRGSGSGEPFGVLTVLSASAGNRVSIQTSGANFGANDPYTLVEALAQRFRRKAQWLMSIKVNNKMRQLGQSNVYHAFTEDLTAEWADVILGKVANESPYMPDTTTSTSANTGLAILGDWMNGFTIARRTGMNVEFVPHLFSTANPGRPTGQRGWFAYSRIGSNVVNTFAFKLLVNTA